MWNLVMISYIFMHKVIWIFLIENESHAFVSHTDRRNSFAYGLFCSWISGLCEKIASLSVKNLCTKFFVVFNRNLLKTFRNLAFNALGCFWEHFRFFGILGHIEERRHIWTFEKMEYINVFIRNSLTVKSHQEQFFCDFLSL